MPKPPLTNVDLPALEPEKRRSYSTKEFDEIDVRVIDYGNYCLLHPRSEKGYEQLWEYLDVEDIRAQIELQARELINNAHRPNNFAAAAYPVGTIDTDFFAIIALRFSIYSDGSERKVWRVFMAAQEGIEEIQKTMTEDIEATVEGFTERTEELGGGSN